jgi:hypothetical protein
LTRDSRHIYENKFYWPNVLQFEIWFHQKRIREKGGRKYTEAGESHQLKHSACTGTMPRQKSPWTMNRDLNNEEKE